MSASGADPPPSAIKCPFADTSLCDGDVDLDLNFAIVEKGLPKALVALKHELDLEFLTVARDVRGLFPEGAKRTLGLIAITTGMFPVRLLSSWQPSNWLDAGEHLASASTGKLNAVMQPYRDKLEDTDALHQALNALDGARVEIDDLAGQINRETLALCKFKPSHLVVRSSNTFGEFLLLSESCPNGYYGRFTRDTITVEIRGGSISSALASHLKN